MEDTLVSIIVPAYNAEGFIERSVGCALAQTHGRVQVVVVDDGSSDDTARIVSSIAARDGRVLLVRHGENRGRLEARRTGIANARGEFTLFLDADDEMPPETCETLLAAQEGRFDIVQCDFEMAYARFVSDDERRFNRDFNRPPALRAEGDDVTHVVFRDRRTTWSLCGKLMRTELLTRALDHIPHGSLTQAEDACIYFIVSCLADSYRGLPSFAGYRYNIDAGTSDARWKTMDLRQFEYSCRYFDSMECIRAFLDETGRMQTLRDDYLVVRREHARSIADKLLHVVERDLRPAAFDLFVKMWPVEEAVAALSEAGRDHAADSLEHVVAARGLACPPRTVKTVAAYHYRMGIGGAERVVAELCALWDDMGYRVVLFADEPREACVQSLPESVEWVQLPTGEGDAGYADRAAALERAIREYEIDALVYHQWWNPNLVWDALLAKTLGVPVCLFCHSVYEVLFFDANPAEFDCSRVFRHLDGIVVLSDFDRRFWQRFNPRVWQSANPATADPGACAPSSLEGKSIVWVGRLAYCDKQPQEAIEIMARVAAHDPQATLTLVGPAASNRELKDLKALARRLGVQGNVVFAGPADDPAPYYRDASMLLLTSRLEGWCLVLAEAKAHGLPCVMYEMPYLTLAQGARGIAAVPQGDRDAAARVVCDLLEDADRREQLGREAREHAAEVAHFDFRALWEDVFAALSQGSPARVDFELDDAQWDLTLSGFKESLDKASRPAVADFAKRKGREIARRAWHRLRRR